MQTYKFYEELPYFEAGKPKDTIQLLKNGKVKYMGKWIPTTQELFHELVLNFKMGVRGQKLPVEIEHRDSGAYGWILDLWTDGFGLFCKVEWTPLGIMALQNKTYGYISAEILFDYTDSMDEAEKVYRAVMGGISLTNRPHIKNITAVLAGFSELLDFPEDPETEEEELEALKDLTEQLKGILVKLKDHPEMYKKKGGPRAKATLESAINNFESYIKERKEAEDEMPDEIKKEDETKMVCCEPETPVEEVAETVAVIEEVLPVVEEEVVEVVEEEKVEEPEPVAVAEVKPELSLTELLEAHKKELEEKNNALFTEMKASLEAEFSEKLKEAEQVKLLAEATAKALQEKDNEREDLRFCSTLIKDGNILVKQKDRVLETLKKARKVGVVKFSETEQVNYHEDLKELLKGFKQIDLSVKASGNPELPKVENKDKAIIALAEQLRKEDSKLSLQDSYILAHKKILEV